MAIEKEVLDQLLAGRDADEVFGKDGLLDELKKALIMMVEELGRRHATYGVVERHYESVGTALLWTLEQGLGPAWTPQTAAASTAAYALISDTMRQGAAKASAEAA